LKNWWWLTFFEAPCTVTILIFLCEKLTGKWITCIEVSMSVDNHLDDEVGRW